CLLVLGKGRVIVKVKQRSETAAFVETSIEAIVIRQKRIIDVVFHVSVAILVTVMYVNFGCALKWNELRNSLKRPVGPAIGFIGQFLFMPLLSFFIGRLLFPRNPEMQLGMFFTGVSPGGGASNMWAVILGLNIDLSITMTTISTFGAFAMMPIWLFTLGKVIFDDAKLDVPYQMISMYAMTLVIPLFIGFLIQKYMKRVAAFLVRILKAFSALLLIFIVVFAIVTNLYLFKLFSWQILVAGLGLPWLGYTVAWLLAVFFKQPNKDALVIAIETGIQNTGISIYLLRFCLSQPEADLTTVVPVSVAIMTPIPLLLLWIAQKFRNRCFKKRKYTPHENSELNSPLSEMSVDNHFAPSTIS
ncbi:PREDICTED: P3 protein-like, partial [Nicrophorus vespilloides]|uniref:P3 protein-like n=1 Tax=Nicrophorus vespilloides TaxID=110193 RepID=A0ABM1N0Y0_NICVS